VTGLPLLRPDEAYLDFLVTAGNASAPMSWLRSLVLPGDGSGQLDAEIVPANDGIAAGFRAWHTALGAWSRAMTALADPERSAPQAVHAAPRQCKTSRHNAMTALRDLGAALLGPVLHQLRDAGIRRLIVSPDGNLHRVPWAALRVPDRDGALRFLIDEFEVHLVPNVARLERLRERPSVPSARLLAAAPFGTKEPSPGTAFRLRDHIRDGAAPVDLPASRGEIEAIGEAFRKIARDNEPVLLHREGATAEVLRKELANAQVIHLATHGEHITHVEVLRRFQILFANATSIPVREILTDLPPMPETLAVVLSACQLGDAVVKGADAAGFAEAFFRAGARLVLAPLWAVADGPTADLMVGWYRHWLAQESPEAATAWQQAVIAFRTSHPQEDHPFYWAGFLPNGDGRIRIGLPTPNGRPLPL